MPQALDHLEFDAIIAWGFITEDAGADVYAEPIVWPWDKDPAVKVATTPAGRTPVAVIPGITRSFLVTAVYADGPPPTRTVLGYFIPGTNHPDWEQEAADRAPP